jgi:cytochrome c peroxidase
MKGISIYAVPALCAAMGLAACGEERREVAQVVEPVDAPYELEIPSGLEGLAQQIPADNPLTVRKVELGKQLYFDPRLSDDNSVACATCHNPRFGFTDGQAVSTGIRGQKGGRSAPTTINRVFSAAQFWDGRAASLEEQAVGPIANPIEMGMTHELVVERIRGIPGYREQFRQVFGTGEITIDQIGKAIASYERTLLSGDSPFDRFQAGDRSALTEQEQQGLALFMGKARCAQCHTGPNFTDERFHNLGVGMDRPEPDLGRYDVTKREEDRGAFRTPTLRDVALSAPYFHDGSAATLLDVVEHYDRGGTPNPSLSPLMRPLRLTRAEKEALAAFMHSLTGQMPLEVLAPPLPEGPSTPERGGS